MTYAATDKDASHEDDDDDEREGGGGGMGGNCDSTEWRQRQTRCKTRK